MKTQDETQIRVSKFNQAVKDHKQVSVLEESYFDRPVEQLKNLLNLNAAQANDLIRSRDAAEGLDGIIDSLVIDNVLGTLDFETVFRLDEIRDTQLEDEFWELADITGK